VSPSHTFTINNGKGEALDLPKANPLEKKNIILPKAK
jgi:hypothetical protein